METSVLHEIVDNWFNFVFVRVFLILLLLSLAANVVQAMHAEKVNESKLTDRANIKVMVHRKLAESGSFRCVQSDNKAVQTGQTGR